MQVLRPGESCLDVDLSLFEAPSAPFAGEPLRRRLQVDPVHMTAECSRLTRWRALGSELTRLTDVGRRDVGTGSVAGPGVYVGEPLAGRAFVRVFLGIVVEVGDAPDASGMPLWPQAIWYHGMEAKLRQVAVVLHSAVLAVGHDIFRQAADDASMPPEKLVE